MKSIETDCRNHSHAALRLAQDMSWQCLDCGMIWDQYETPLVVISDGLVPQ